MEAIEPAYGSGVLLLMAAGAVALLLFLIMKVKLHAFVALVLVSVVTALAVGFPLGDVPDALMFGFAGTLGEVALLVAFGVMLGRLLEITGGAQTLAETLITRFGEKRAPLALGVAAMLFGFPIFLDAGLIIFLPIILTVARRFGGSLLLYAIPAAGGFATMHAIVPPHPGPVAATTSFQGSMAVTVLVGVPVAVAAWFIGVKPLASRLGARIHVDVPEVLFGQVNGGQESIAGEDGKVDRPGFGTVVSLLVLPLVLISLGTVMDTLIAAKVVGEKDTWVNLLKLVGNTPVALLLTVLIAIFVLGRPRASMARISDIVDSALAPVCSIILITGAGGMFGGILELSGIGDALSGSLKDLGLPLIVQAFVIATLLRVAQGSATVALTTTSGLLAGAVADAHLGDVQIALLVVAVAAGATVLSHLNDSGFWLVSRFFGMDEKTTLKTWTVMETTLGLSAFAIAAALWTVT